MLHEYHVIYSVQYHPRFHVTAVGLGTYYPWIRGHYCTLLCDSSKKFCLYTQHKNHSLKDSMFQSRYSHGPIVSYVNYHLGFWDSGTLVQNHIRAGP
jgi:hypothetical protein